VTIILEFQPMSLHDESAVEHILEALIEVIGGKVTVTK
jgi:hypothetical protein